MKEPVLFLTDSWSGGYFHWMAEVLPRVALAREKGFEFPVLLDHRFLAMPYVIPSLALFNIQPLFASGNDVFRLKKVNFISHFTITGNFHEAWLQKTRTVLRKKALGNAVERIYISRKQAQKRKVVNEEELLPVLNELGFSVVETDNMSFEEQQQLFSGCIVLVSIHGAGLTNMLFMDEDTAVVELRRKGDQHNNCYFSMASALRIRYHYMTCEVKKDECDQHNADLNVDCSQFKQLLEVVISKGQ